MRFKLRNSLLSKYLLIILSALVLLPLTFPFVSLLFFLSMQVMNSDIFDDYRYQNGAALEKRWHEEAKKLGGASAEVIDRALRRLQTAYPEAGMFWVDQSGTTRLQLPDNSSLPDVWSAAYTVQFMKERINGDPFTIVAFIGETRDEGFIVFEVPREMMQAPVQRVPDTAFIAGTLLILAGFLLISFFFFYRIRRRLVRLQTAMTGAPGRAIPDMIEVQNEDEIGRLEATFNEMVRKLDDSRVRESKEEALRRDLIAKLSHDLRTPLTTIRGHAFSLRNEELSDRGMESTLLIERKIDYLSRLIDNLFSYSLLSAGKYPYQPQEIEIVRTVRSLFAGWYPVFEQEGFTIELDLAETAVYWQVDPAWLERVLDNYVQNVLRHAKSGRYIGMQVTKERGGTIIITDHGPGMETESAEKGAGLGLSIISLMLKEMKLQSATDSKPGETIVRLSPKAGG
ncbi:sensor histidine kinase [Paenibacillus beijingensis]|uniref:histidine kinase n=1 Tax=Paenibacillus beijingensis TaxID=1126833 RepID=A0A0D5NL89_9BACL|nr:HAMP domain-containing sensor histidine kinase [Paenibacillus beijingensis]AJY75762.1 histidine kinase [Paenibacillus beijingensis]